MVVTRQFQDRYPILDKHALSATSTVEASIPKLAEYLTSIAKNEEEKARVIYRWITDRIKYDFAGYSSGKYSSTAPNDVLKNRTSVCSGYAKLFDSLCKASGLECACITGYAKGYGYSEGQTFTSTNHEWNAIKIRGEWGLIESTWGAGYVDGTKFVKQYDDSSFLLPPNQFIYRHLPQDAKWQLLDKPISMEEYMKMVNAKNHLFLCGLTIKSHPYGLIRLTTSNTVQIELFGSEDVAFMASLSLDRQKIESTTFCQSKGQLHTVSVELPQKGKAYHLSIFCKQLSSNEKSYNEAISYVLQADEKATLTKSGFPTTFQEFNAHKCYLNSPIACLLDATKPISYSIVVPGATEVSVVVSNDFHNLKQEKPTLFEGKLDLSKYKSGTNVSVFAKFPNAKNLAGLLQQKIK